MAPEATLTAVVSARPPLTVSLPTFTLVVPVYVLAPDSVSVPVSDLTKAPVPEMAPEKVTAPELTTLRVPLFAMVAVGVSPPRFASSYTTFVPVGMSTCATLLLVGMAPPTQFEAVDQLPPDAPV